MKRKPGEEPTEFDDQSCPVLICLERAFGWEESQMETHVLRMPYPEDLLLSLKKNHGQFEAEARLLPAVKLYEMGQISTGRAAQLAGMNRVAFMFELNRFGLSPLGQDPHAVADDLASA